MHLLEQISTQCALPAARLTIPAQELHQTLQKVMRSFGRQCRGKGKVFVTLVRQTEKQLLDLGESLAPWSQEAQTLLEQTPHLPEVQRERLRRDLDVASDAHRRIVTQSHRLTQGKKLSQYKIVNAYDPTIAPIIKGKSNCPAQCGRKTGIVSEPATGFIFANRVPEGNPSDPSYVLPLLDNVQHAIDLIAAPKRVQVHSLGGDLGINDAALRHALHQRGMLTVGIPTTVEPINPTPSPAEVLDILNTAGLHRRRTPHQVHLACASGDSRPVVESHIATLMARGAGHVPYKGLEGAVRQMGMTVMAHNGAVLVRIRQQRVSKRGQKFHQLLGLNRYKFNEINVPKFSSHYVIFALFRVITANNLMNAKDSLCGILIGPAYDPHRYGKSHITVPFVPRGLIQRYLVREYLTPTLVLRLVEKALSLDRHLIAGR